MTPSAPAGEKKRNAVIPFLAAFLCVACASRGGPVPAADKNITDYFNILSGQGLVRGRIISAKGADTINMDNCDDLLGAKLDRKVGIIRYSYTNPCAGPPPHYTVVLTLANTDTAKYIHVWSMERTWNDETSAYYRLSGAEFVRVEKKELPADVAAKFNRNGR